MKNLIGISKKTLSLFVPYLSRLISIFVLLLISSLISFFAPLLSEKLIDDGFSIMNIQAIVTFAIILFAMNVLNSILSCSREAMRVKIFTNLESHLRKQSFEHIYKSKASLFDNAGSAEIVQSLDDDISAISAIVSQESLESITQVFFAIGGLAGLLCISWRLALIVAVYIPIKAVIAYLVTKKSVFYMSEWIEARKNYSSWFGNVISGIFEVRNYYSIEQKSQEFIKLNKPVEKYEYKKNVLMILNQNMDNVVFEFINALVYILGAYFILGDELTLGGLLSFITYALLVIVSLSEIVNLFSGAAAIYPSARRYFKFLEYEEEDYEGREITSISEIEFKNVAFSYTSQDNQVLSDVSFKISKSEKVAIVGDNGSGKSTILKLLMRMYNPIEGEIKIDQTSLRNIKITSLREKLSVVSQKPYLFNDTIKNNICLHREVDEYRLKKILVAVGLDEIVAEYTLDYCVGDDGKMLSGGQIQKIAIARSLIQRSEVYIFDESTSNIDTEGKRMFCDLLSSLEMRDAIIITVTHDNEIIKQMDKVLHVCDGKVVQMKPFEYFRGIGV